MYELEQDFSHCLAAVVLWEQRRLSTLPVTAAGAPLLQLAHVSGVLPSLGSVPGALEVARVDVASRRCAIGCRATTHVAATATAICMARNLTSKMRSLTKAGTLTQPARVQRHGTGLAAIPKACQEAHRSGQAVLTGGAIAAMAAKAAAAATVAAATAPVAAAAVLAVVAAAEAGVAAAATARALLAVGRGARTYVLQPPGHLLVCLLHSGPRHIRPAPSALIQCRQTSHKPACIEAAAHVALTE